MAFRKIVLFLWVVCACELHAENSSGWWNSEPSSNATFQANLAAPALPYTGPPPVQALGAPVAGGNSADFVTPEIQTLADGLQNDPIQIFNYVYNYVDFEPYYGSKKGAAMTLLEGRGNAFDTCALFVSLLRASGFSPSYRISPCVFSYSTLRTWLGLAAYPLGNLNDTQVAQLFPGNALPAGFTPLQGRQLLNASNFLTPRGYPIVTYTNADNIVFDHVWVQLSHGGTTYQLDPSLKGHFDFSATDFLTAAGYNRTAFLNAVGGTVGTGSIKDLSASALASQMLGFSSNILQWLRNNKPNDTINSLMQGRRIDQREITTFAQASGVNSILTQWKIAIETVTAIPESYISKLNITLGDWNYTSKTFTTTYHTGTILSTDLRGQKLALTFNGNLGEIYLENTLWKSQNLPLSDVDIKFEWFHDHYEWIWNGTQYVKQKIGKSNQTDVRAYRKNNGFAYAFPYGFDVNGKHLRLRQEKLDKHLRDNLVETSRQVRTEVLNVMGLNWMYQTKLSDNLVAANMNLFAGAHHRFGRMCQEESFYVDIAMQQLSTVSRATTPEILLVVPVAQLFQSALEHAMIEQTQGATNQAASTVKMLHLANQNSKRIFRANSGNWQTGANIRSLLTGYSAPLLAQLDASVAAGATVLVPEVGNIAVGTSTPKWTGGGYAARTTSPTGTKTEMLITGNINGGFNSQNGAVSSGPLVLSGTSESGYWENGSSQRNVPYAATTVPRYYAADPVDMATGAFVLDKTDIQIGSAAPRGLVFSRHYDSNRRYDKSAGLGYGWTHNYHCRAIERTSMKGALGEVTSHQMVPWLIAAAVARDVHGSAPATAKEWAVPALIAQWATDQLRNNSVSIVLGASTVEFVKLPNGTYYGPPGTKFSLVKTGSGKYELTERHGATLRFRTDGWLETITDLHSNVSDFTYAGGKLSTVTDCNTASFKRTMTLSWVGDQIQSVSDGTGRSVDFTYSAAGDMVTAQDVEDRDWKYEYNAEHLITRLRDHDNRIITENTYDSLGRVAEQRSMGDALRLWKLYYSGFNSIEEDPLGGKRRFYYDDRGRPIGMRDALGNSDGRAYDGQDHIVVSLTAKQELSSAVYNADQNLVQETDAAGKMVDYFYDAQLRLQRVNDKRGYDTLYTYTPQHRISTITDAENNVSLRPNPSDFEGGG
jgi:YD repeat-containing protein